MDLYFYLDQNGQQQGPVAANELPNYGVTRNIYVWKQGMSNWQMAGSIPELSDIFPPSVTPVVPAPAVNTTAQSSETVNPKADKPKGKNNKNLIFIIVALVIGYLVYSHWNSSGYSALNGHYTPVISNPGTLPDIIISGDNFTLEYDLIGTKADKTAKFKYKDGNIVITEGDTSLSIPCEIKNGSLWWSGVEYKKVK